MMTALKPFERAFINKALGRDQTRANLMHAFIETVDDRRCIVATDGHRAHLLALNVGDLEGVSGYVSIHKKSGDVEGLTDSDTKPVEIKAVWPKLGSYVSDHVSTPVYSALGSASDELCSVVVDPKDLGTPLLQVRKGHVYTALAPKGTIGLSPTYVHDALHIARRTKLKGGEPTFDLFVGDPVSPVVLRSNGCAPAGSRYWAALIMPKRLG